MESYSRALVHEKREERGRGVPCIFRREKKGRGAGEGFGCDSSSGEERKGGGGIVTIPLFVTWRGAQEDHVLFEREKGGGGLAGVEKKKKGITEEHFSEGRLTCTPIKKREGRKGNKGVLGVPLLRILSLMCGIGERSFSPSYTSKGGKKGSGGGCPTIYFLD